MGSGKGQERTNEWVEIYNPTGSAVNLSGWKICATGGCDVIPPSSPVPSHGFAVVSPEDATWGFWPDIPAEAIKIVLGSKIGSDGLDNQGDRVILKNASNAFVDAMSYGDNESQLDPPVNVPGEGNSMARIVKGYDTDSALDWITNITPNPGTNPSSGGTEVIRFTADGIEVAGLERGLEPLADNGDYEDEEKNTEEEEEEYIEPAEPALEDATESTKGEINTEPTPTPSVENSQTLGVELTDQAPGVEDNPTEENQNTEEPAIPPDGEVSPSTGEASGEELILIETEEGITEENQNTEEPVSPQEEITAEPTPSVESVDQTPAESIPTPSVENSQTLGVGGVGDSGDGNESVESQAENAAIKENDNPPVEAVSQDNPDQ